jgi:integrase
MPLTDRTVKATKTQDKAYKAWDTGGLFLLVAPTGGRLWRFKYRVDGKEKLLALGAYPDVSLKDARLKRDDARRDLSQGVDPGVARKTAKTDRKDRASNSFEAVAREWYAKEETTWAPAHATRVKRLMERDVFPWLGGEPVADINAPHLLKVLRRIESRDAIDTAHRARGYCGEVFRFAIASGLAERDPAADLRDALKTAKGSHFPAVIDPVRLGGILRAFDAYQGTPIVSAALRMMPMVFVRPGELRTARWADIDLDKAEWRFVTSKTETALVVPLAKQVVAILKDLHPITCGSPYVFPSQRSEQRPMSEAAVLVAMRIMGFSKEELSGHGFRATARTMIEEQLGVRYEIIEQQLGHAVRDANGRAYNRVQFVDERRKMMQRWADYLDKLKKAKKAAHTESVES